MPLAAEVVVVVYQVVDFLEAATVVVTIQGVTNLLVIRVGRPVTPRDAARREHLVVAKALPRTLMGTTMETVGHLDCLSMTMRAAS